MSDTLKVTITIEHPAGARVAAVEGTPQGGRDKRWSMLPFSTTSTAARAAASGGTGANETGAKGTVAWLLAEPPLNLMPTGTTLENWDSWKMGELRWTDPSDTFEREKLAWQLKEEWVWTWGVRLNSPAAVIKDDTKTVKDLWQFCLNNQVTS